MQVVGRDRDAELAEPRLGVQPVDEAARGLRGTTSSPRSWSPARSHAASASSPASIPGAAGVASALMAPGAYPPDPVGTITAWADPDERDRRLRRDPAAPERVRRRRDPPGVGRAHRPLPRRRTDRDRHPPRRRRGVPLRRTAGARRVHLGRDGAVRLLRVRHPQHQDRARRRGRRRCAPTGACT